MTQRAVLAGDDDGVDAQRAVAVVFDGHLRLAVGPEVVEHAVTPRARKPFGELVREHDRQRHQFFGFSAREAEHQALIAGAAGVDAHGDVGRLAVDRREHGAGFAVEPELAAVVADLVDRRADDLLEVDVGARRDFAGDDSEAGRDERLAGDAADGILGEDGVENRIGNLIGDLVGVSFGDRFRRKQMPSLTAHPRAPSGPDQVGQCMV